MYTDLLKHKHLTIQERQCVEEGILHAHTKAQIARTIHKDPSTVAKEIRKHRRLTYKCKLILECSTYKVCPHGRICTEDCPDYKPFTCYRRDKSPGACNGCDKYSKCRFNKYKYNAQTAQRVYRNTLVASRAGLDLDQDTIERLAHILLTPIKQGQSPYMVLKNHPETGICMATLYTYIKADVFKPYGLSVLDLRLQVKRKIPKTLRKNQYKKRNTIRHIEGRRYADYMRYRQEHDYLQVCQMDTVYNASGGPFLQTFKFLSLNFLFAILHEKKTAESMVKGIDTLQEVLGTQLFASLCPIILTDRGAEFQATIGLETAIDGSKRCHVFYCEPMQSGQKGSLENRHKELRYILPKGKSFQALHLHSQKDLNLALSHLNSYPCKAIMGKTPFFLAKTLCPELIGKLEAFGIYEIPKDQVTLKPVLLNP